jgi:hypothetical protein
MHCIELSSGFPVELEPVSLWYPLNWRVEFHNSWSTQENQNCMNYHPIFSYDAILFSTSEMHIKICLCPGTEKLGHSLEIEM